MSPEKIVPVFGQFLNEFCKKFITNDVDLYQQIFLSACSNSPVLIHGETGTGKELVARAIHEYSERSGRPFVAVNCALIPHDHIYSELFGVEGGSYTGVTKSRDGYFVSADTGTIFLDEIGDMPVDAQAGLLRVLETGQVKRLGADERTTRLKKPVDIRIVAATNRNIWDENIFRADLFYRLNSVPIETQPIARNWLVLPAMLRKFIDNPEIVSIDFHFLAFCIVAPWRGNVRELRNFCSLASSLQENGRLCLFPAVQMFFRRDRYCPKELVDYFSANRPNFLPSPYQEIKKHGGVAAYFGQELPDPTNEEELLNWTPIAVPDHKRISLELETYLKLLRHVQTWNVSENEIRSRFVKIKSGLHQDEQHAYSAYYYRDIPLETLHEFTVPPGFTNDLLILCNEILRLYWQIFGRDSLAQRTEQTPEKFDLARKEFERRYYRSIFSKYQGFTDHRIGKIIGQDSKTIAKKRAIFYSE